MLSPAMMLIKPALLSYPGMLIISLLASGYRTWAPRLAMQLIGVEDFNPMITTDQVPPLVRGMLDLERKAPRSWRRQMPAEDVRYWRKNRKHLLAASISHF
jgi:hypothetical protein